MTVHRWFSAPSAAAAAALLLVASGCATTWQVETYEPAGAALASKRTFAWTGGRLGTVAVVDPTVAASTDTHIRDAVVAGLVRKGYTQVTDAGSADMLVGYQVVGSRKVVTSERPRFNAPPPDDVLMQSNPQPPAASELPRERTVRDGTVVIFVDEPRTERLLWRGEITAETRPTSRENATHTAADMASAIVDKFPQRTTGP
jgi:Domain of unknown function (DUF4136)